MSNLFICTNKQVGAQFPREENATMSELAQRILNALSLRSVGDIVTDDEARQLAGNPEMIEFAAATYELKEAGYIELVIGLKWRILRKGQAQ